MKTILFLITIAVIAAAAYLGKLDHDAARARAKDPAAAAASGRRPAAPPGPEAQGDPQASSAAEVVPRPAPGPPPEAIAAAIRALEERLLEEDFAGAGEAARREIERLLEEHGPALAASPEARRALDPIRRAALKAGVFEALVRPLERETLPERIFQVRLHNGNTLIARRAERSGDRWEVALVPSGEVALGAEKVQGVTSRSRVDYLIAEWEEISKNLDRLKSPIDLYVRGVSRCFRLGMRAEGFELLEKLLAMPQSSRVPAIFAADADGKLVRSWEQAAGRAPLDPLPDLGPAAAAAAESAAGAAAPIPAAGEPVGTAAEARDLLARAQTIYRSVVVEAEGNLKDLEGARAHLEKAAEILSRLPPEDPQVRVLKPQVANLLHAVIKSLPF